MLEKLENDFIDERIIIEITNQNRKHLPEILKRYNQKFSELGEIDFDNHYYLSYCDGWFTDFDVYSDKLIFIDYEDLEQYFFKNTLGGTQEFI